LRSNGERKRLTLLTSEATKARFSSSWHCLEICPLETLLQPYENGIVFAMIADEKNMRYGGEIAE
jgi:hypothetical protein